MMSSPKRDMRLSAAFFQHRVTRLIGACPWILLTCSLAFAQQDHKSWKDYGGGPDTSRFTR